MGNLRSGAEEPKHVILHDYDLDADEEGHLGDAGISVNSTEDEKIILFVRKKKGKCAWLAGCCWCCKKVKRDDDDDDELMSEEDHMRVVDSVSD